MKLYFSDNIIEDTSKLLCSVFESMKTGFGSGIIYNVLVYYSK